MDVTAAGAERPFALEAHGLCVTGGKKTLLEEFDLVLRQGEVHTLIGKNGTGKTTLLKVLSGMRSPRSGVVETHGGRMGALIGEPSFLPELSGLANAEYLAYALGVADPTKEAGRVLDLVGLDGDVREEPAGEYSKGQSQRLGIALALVADPAVLLFDEPFSFIDLPGVHSIKEVLHQLVQNRGTAILITSHICDHVIGFADRFSFITGKRITFQASAREIDNLCERYVLLETGEPERALAVLERAGLGYSVVLDRAGGIRVKTKTVPPGMVRELEAAGISVSSVRPYGESYEELFCRLSDSGR